MAGRQAASVMIVPQNQVMGEEAVIAESWRLTNFSMTVPLECIQWLATRRLLKNSRTCAECRTPMSLIRRRDIQDQWTWKCRDCRKKISVRRDSFFSKSHLSLQQLIVIIYCWSFNFPQAQILHEAALSQLATHTIVDWCSFCRDICEEDVEVNPMVIGGLNEDGTSKVVEIDESKFFHRKYHRGLWRQGHWVFGGIERGTGKCFLVEVENRTKETLRQKIEQYILPGTVIMSDGWASYANIRNYHGGIYEHNVIVHEQHIVDPNDRAIHKQIDENMWMRAKLKLDRRQFGTSGALFVSYHHEFVWRNRQRETDIFSAFLCAIARVHNFPDDV